MQKIDMNYVLTTMWELLDNVDFYKHQISTGQMDNTYLEFEYRKGQMNYESICRRLNSLNLQFQSPTSNINLTLKDFKDHILEILTKILGDNYYDKIKNVPLILEDRPFAMDAVTEIKHKNGQTITNIKISNELVPLSIAAANHEIMHKFIEEIIEHTKNIIGNIHYHELPSILIEYITVIELAAIYPEDNIIEKHLLSRISHDCMLQSNSNLYLEAFKKGDGPYFERRYNEIKEYLEHYDYGYIVSNIIANRLLEIYQNDEEKVKYFFRSLLSAEKTIIELLKEFNISLNSKETINPYIKKIEYFERQN